MKTDYYNWDEIFRDAADILARSLAEKKVPISKASQLYAALEKQYRSEKQNFPEAVTFRKRLHRQLNIDESQRIYKTTLYQLIGQYQKMTLPALAEYLTPSMQPVNCNDCYLFYRINREERTIADNRKLLYATAKVMKEHFKQRILFLSYDDDTIVILCADSDAKNQISAYIQKSLRQEQEGSENV